MKARNIGKAVLVTPDKNSISQFKPFYQVPQEEYEELLQERKKYNALAKLYKLQDQELFKAEQKIKELNASITNLFGRNIKYKQEIKELREGYKNQYKAGYNNGIAEGIKQALKK